MITKYLCDMSLFSLIVNTRPPVSIDSNESSESTVERDRVDNFRRHQLDDDADMSAMIRTSRPYAQTEFNQPEYSKHEINNSCEFVPAANLIRYSTLFHGIPLYIDPNLTPSTSMICQAEQLSSLLIGLATQVFHLPVETLHLFRDVDSG